MRINFSGAYNQVARLLGASAAPTVGGAEGVEFAETLSKLGVQTTENIKPIAERPERIPPPPEDLMARLQFGPAPSKTPPLSPFGGEQLLPDAVKEADASVKTPSGVKVRRVPGRELAAYTERMKQVEQIVTQVGRATGIDPALGMAVAKAESSFNPKAISSDGHESKGLFQLLDSTGKELHEQAGVKREYDPFDPHLNVNLGVRYLRRLHDLFSQSTKLPNDLESVSAANSSSLEKLAVAAFNAGEGRVAAAQARARAAGFDPSIYEQVEGYLPKSTQEYVGRVIRYKAMFGPDDIG